MAASSLHDCLTGGERLLWSGRPAQGLLFTLHDLFLVPFSILWCGFAIFWETSVMAANAPLLFKLWGVPFVLVGLYFVFGRFLVDAWLRSGTIYGVTDRRVLILRAAPFHSFISLDLVGLLDIRLRRGLAGRGTIQFGEEPMSFLGRTRRNTWSPALANVPQFLAIPDAQTVYDRIEEARTRR